MEVVAKLVGLADLSRLDRLSQAGQAIGGAIDGTSDEDLGEVAARRSVVGGLRHRYATATFSSWLSLAERASRRSSSAARTSALRLTPSRRASSAISWRSAYGIEAVRGTGGLSFNGRAMRGLLS